MPITNSEVAFIILAKIDQLEQAIDKSNAKIRTLATTSQSVGASFGNLGKIIAGAFTVEGIRRFVENMADLGEQTESVMARLGQTAEQVGNMSGVAKLSGTNITEMATSIERMSLSVQRSTADALGPQAQALKVLGLNAKELIGLPTDQYFLKLSEAVSKFNPSLNLTNALMVIGGRGVASMIPALRLGADGYKALQEAVRKAQDGLAAAIPGMADTNNKLNIMSISAQSLGARIFTVLKPAIDLIVTSITTWMQKLDSKTIQEFATVLIDKLGNAVIQLIGIFYEFGGTLDEIYGKLKTILTGVAIGGAVGILGGGAGVLAGALAGGGIAAAWGSFMEQNKKGADKAAVDIAKQQLALVLRIRQMMGALKGAIAGGSGETGGAAGGQNAGAINEGARDALSSQKSRYETEIALLQQTLARKKILYDLDAGLWKITDDRKFALTMEATEKEFQAEATMLKRIRDLWPAHSKEWEVENQKMVAATAKFQTEMVNLNAQSLLSMKAKWDEYFGALQSSFNGQLRGLLAGTTTFTQAFRAVIGDMVIYFIQAIEKMVFQWIAGQAAQLLATQSTTGAKAASEAAAAESTLPIRIASFTSTIAADAALVFAGIFANLAPFLGPAAAGPAAAGQAATLAQLANVPKFETGAWQVPSTMYAQIHKDEMIIPAGPARAIREGGGGGGGDTFHINAVDAPSFISLISRHGPQVAKVISDTQKRQPSTRGKW